MVPRHPVQKQAPSKRGRPRRGTREAEILEAGFQEFAEKGFDAARLDEVAARAGVAKGTLYLYCESKEALFEAAVRSRIQPVVGRVRRLAEFYPGPTRFLLRMIIRFMYRQIARGELGAVMRIVISEGNRFPAITEFYHREFIGQMNKLIETIVAKGVARGEMRDGAATRLPMVIIGPGVMAAIWQMTFQPHHPIDLDAFYEAHVDLIMNGISREST
ncbi:MAG: TetR/AcrR family transcriptional regulator [Pseudomonadota bacterium]